MFTTRSLIALLLIIFSIVFVTNAGAQENSITINPEEGFIFEFDQGNPVSTLFFTIYNSGLNSVSLTLNPESADSTYLLYVDEPDTANFNGNIWRMRPDGSEKTQLTFNTLDFEPDFSHDGSKIVFYSLRSGNYDIWIMDSDGTNMANISNHDSSDAYPHWSPYSKHIIFWSNRDEAFGEIYRMTASGDSVERITTNDIQDVRPRYSPDGNYFVTLSRVPGGERNTFVYTNNGQSYTEIGVFGMPYDFQASWTPDGNRVVWSSGNHNIGELDIVSANKDGTDIKLEYATSENDYIPRYSPDGQYLAFSKSTFYPTGGDEIFVWHKATDRIIQLSGDTPVTREWGPAWSPFINSPNWISIDKSELQILPGDSALVTITVDLTNVSIDYQTASIIIKDSVTNNLLKIVPVNAVLFTDVNERTEGAIPYQFTLSQNYPNPFNLGTVIRFQVPSTKFVALKIYDLLGREVQTLVNEYISAGIYEVNFDASSLASSLYLYKLTAGNFTLTKRMMLVK